MYFVNLTQKVHEPERSICTVTLVVGFLSNLSSSMFVFYSSPKTCCSSRGTASKCCTFTVDRALTWHKQHKNNINCLEFARITLSVPNSKQAWRQHEATIAQADKFSAANWALNASPLGLFSVCGSSAEKGQTSLRKWSHYRNLHSFIHSSIHPSIHSFIHASIHPYHPSISSIHPFIHPCMHIHSFHFISFHSFISFIHYINP